MYSQFLYEKSNNPTIKEKILTISFVPGGQLDGCEQILHFSLSNTNGR